jgi:hypothetical protein
VGPDGWGADACGAIDWRQGALHAKGGVVMLVGKLIDEIGALIGGRPVPFSQNGISR